MAAIDGGHYQARLIEWRIGRGLRCFDLHEMTIAWPAEMAVPINMKSQGNIEWLLTRQA
jgi:hypothetical protein